MKTILVIEDNTDVRENLVEILELAGYNAVEAADGKEGVDKAREVIPDLILCDIMMPKLDGYGVLKILNREPALLTVPFMFLTAKAEKEDLRKGMGLGADDYITKPFDDANLLESIEIRIAKSERLKAIEPTEKGIRQFYDAARAEEALESLTESCEVRHYRKKDVLYQIGQYPMWLYYIVGGQIKCHKTAESGKELISQMCGAGEYIGLSAVIQSNKYSDTATVTGDAKVMLIPVSDFKKLLFNNRDFSSRFIKLLVSHNKQIEDQLMDMAFSSVRKRVSKALLYLSAKHDGGPFSIYRDDLAAMTGTAKETVIRTISDFKSEKLIQISDNQITILEYEQLKNLPQ